MLDANVPSWRFQRQGREAIQQQYREWYGTERPRLDSWAERPASWGAVIELELVEGTGGDETRFREVHLLEARDDLITTHVLYCTGGWDRATVERHRAKAPMVR